MSSRTVDSKVVEMKFDNQNFEKNVSQSMKTMDSLKSKLDFKGTESKAAKSLDNISKYANNLSLDGLGKAIDTINYRFSTLGVVATNVISSITSGLTGKLTGAINSIFGQITSGGKSRAMNLAQAQFQLENLLKDGNEVSAVMENVKNSVDGTAYGLDAAAVVAAQLVASGSKAGDELQNQLRAIAGVAALTGSTYEDIGAIFTTVAGQGNLMTQQMNQFAYRGLNVAAVMAKQLGMSEQEFRDSVSERGVSFQQFADAMVAEFGDAAGKANETFTGALSNVQSALSRIGEKFYTPWLKQTRDMLNQFRLSINAVNKELDPFINKLNEMYAALSNRVQSVLKDITSSFSPDKIGNNGFVKFISDIATATDAITKVIFGRKDLFPTDALGFGAFDALLSILETIGSVIGGITTAVVNAFNNTSGLIDLFSGVFAKMSDAANYVRDWFSDTTILEKLTSIFEGLAAVVKIFLSVLNAVGIVFKSVLGAFGLWGDVILNLGVSISDAIKKISDFISESKILQDVAEKIAAVINTLGNVYKSFANASSGVIKSMAGAVSSLFGAFFGGDSIGIADVIGKITDKIKAFVDAISSDKVSTTISNIGDALSGFFNKIGEAFRKMSGGFFSSELITLIVGAAYKIGWAIRTIGFQLGGLKSFFQVLKNGKQFLEESWRSINSAIGMLSDLSGVLAAFTASINADALIKIALGIGVLALSIYTLSGIPWEDLVKSIAAVAGLMGILLVAVVVISKLIATPLGKPAKITGWKSFIKEFIGQGKEVLIFREKFEAIGDAFMKMGIAVLAMAKALQMIASAFKEDWTSALIACIVIIGMVGVFIGTMFILTRIIDKEFDKTALTRAAAAMLIMSISIAIMAKSFAIIAGVVSGTDPGSALTAALVMVSMIVSLALAVSLITETLNTVRPAALAASILIILAISAFIIAVAVSFAIIGVTVHSMSWGEILATVGIMIGMVIALVATIMILAGATMVLSPAVLLATAAAILVLAVFVVALGFAFLEFAVSLNIIIAALTLLTGLLSSNNSNKAWEALLYLGVMLAGLALILPALTFGIGGVAVLILLGDALKTLIPLMAALILIPTDQIWEGVMKIAEALAAFAVVGLIATALAVPLLIFSVVLGALGLALSLCTYAMKIFFEALLVTSMIADMAAPTISNAMQKLADGFHDYIMHVLDNIGEFIDKLNSEMEKNKPKIKNTIHNILTTITETVSENVPEISRFIKETLTALADEFELTGVVNFVTALRDFINRICQFLADVINPTVESEGGLTAETYGTGLYGKIRIIAERAIEIFVAFCNALSDAVDTHREELTAAIDKLSETTGELLRNYLYPKAMKAAGWVMKGLIQGLSMMPSANAQLQSSASAIGGLIIDSVDKATDSHSPSKKAIKCAKNVIDGLVVGLRKTVGIENASYSLGSSLIDNISSVFDVLQSYVEDDYTIEPTISPVLDMGGVTASADAINNMLSGNTTFGIAANVNAKLSGNQNANPYSEITKAINTLHGDLKDLEANNYVVNGITYDDGTAIAGAVGELIRATKVGRRM